MHVLDLPYNVLDDIIGYLNQSDLVSLGRTNRVFPQQGESDAIQENYDIGLGRT